MAKVQVSRAGDVAESDLEHGPRQATFEGR